MSAPEGVSTEKEIAGYEILPHGTSDAVVRVTYVIRDSAGVSICLRGDPPGKAGESYIAEDKGDLLQLAKVRPDGPYQTFVKKPLPPEWSSSQERTLEFSAADDVLTATLNGSLVASIRDASLASGHGTVLLRRNLLLKKVEFRIPATTPAPSSTKAPLNEWIKLLDSPEAVALSGIPGLTWKDGWLPITGERLYLLNLAGVKRDVRNVSFRATVRPAANPAHITLEMRLGSHGRYNLDIFKDRLVLRRVTIEPPGATPGYLILKDIPLVLTESADGAFKLECGIYDDLISVKADGASVIDVRDGLIAGAGRLVVAAATDEHGGAMMKDMAIKLLFESPMPGAWTDWVRADLQYSGWNAVSGGVTTDLPIRGSEILGSDTRDGAARMTYLLRDASGVQITARGRVTNGKHETYVAEDEKGYLRIGRRLPDGVVKPLAGREYPAGLTRESEHVLEFRVVGHTLTATLNGTFSITVQDDTLPEGEWAMVLKKGALVKRLEVQTPRTR